VPDETDDTDALFAQLKASEPETEAILAKLAAESGPRFDRLLAALKPARLPREKVAELTTKWIERVEKIHRECDLPALGSLQIMTVIYAVSYVH